VFCPNCGTQNAEGSTACSSCGFNLKGSAAPKFKGTMLMNQGAMGGPPPGAPPTAAPGGFAPPAPAGMGTMLMNQDDFQPPPGAQPPAAPAPGAVNPLGGTVAFDGPAPGGFGAPPAGGGLNLSKPADPSGGFGAPPGGGFGAPPAGGGFGTPPAGGGFGGYPASGLDLSKPVDPSGGFGGPPGGGFGGPPGGGFGGPPGGGFGGPPGGGFGGGPGFGGPVPGAGPRPKKRSVQLMLILSLCGIIGNAVSRAGGDIEILGVIGGLISLGGLVAFVFTVIQLLELKAFTNDPDFSWWMCFICCVNLWFFWAKVPPQVARARQMAGLNPVTKSPWAYVFLSTWALASDLEELSQ